MATVTSLGFNISSKWDASGVRAARNDLMELQVHMRRISGAVLQVGVDVDDAKAKAELAKIRAQAENMRAKLNVSVNSGPASAAMKMLTRDRTIHVDVDDENIVRSMERYDKAVLRSMNSVRQLGDEGRNMGFYTKVLIAGLIAGFAALPGVISLVGAALSVGLVGASGIMAAVLLKDNALVQGAFERLKTEGVDTLRDSAAPMAGALSDALNSVTDHIQELAPQLRQMWTATAPLMQPTVEALIHMGEEAIPGITGALAHSKPLIAGFDAGMRGLGRAVGEGFRVMSTEAKAFGDILDITFSRIGEMFLIFSSRSAEFAAKGRGMWDGFLGGLNGVIDGILGGLSQALELGGDRMGKFMDVMGTQSGSVFGALTGQIGNLGGVISEHLTPVIQDLGPKMTNLINKFGSELKPLLNELMVALAPVIQQLGNGMSPALDMVLMAVRILTPSLVLLLNVIEPIAPVLLPLVVAWKMYSQFLIAAKVAQVAFTAVMAAARTALALYTVATRAHGTASAVAAAKTWLLNTAMLANPIGLIIVAIAALVAGIVYLATKTQFFQTVWEGLKIAFKAVVDFIILAWEKFKEILVVSWNLFWNTLRDFVMGIWNTVKNGWQWLWDTVRNVWTSFWELWWAVFSGAWTRLRDFVVGIWNWIKDRWDDFWNGVRIIWNAFQVWIQQIWNTVWNWIKDTAKRIWDWVQLKWDEFLNGVKMVLNAALDWVKNIWNTAWGWVRDTVQSVWDGIQQKFTEFKDGVIGTIKGLVAKVKEVWDKITGIFSAPVEAVKGVWNTVAGPFGLPKFATGGEVEHKAVGGSVIGPGTGTSDSIPAMLSNGEHVWTAAEVQAAGGHKEMLRMRDYVLRGRPDATKQGLGLAAGGPVEWMWGRVQSMEPSMQLTSSYRNSNDYHGQGKAIDVSNGTDSTPGMRGLTKGIHDTWGAASLELIHSPSPYNIKNGRSVGDGFGFYGAGTMNQHRNHVHWAVDRPLDGSPGRPVGVGGGGYSGPTPEQLEAHRRAVEAINKIRQETLATGARIHAMNRAASPGFIGPVSSTELTSAAKNKYGIFAPAGDVHSEGTDKVGGGAVATLNAKLAALQAAAAVSMGGYGKGYQFYVDEIEAAAKERSLERRAAKIGVATALVESNLKMYANSNVPASLSYPHDAVGSDHDSVGLFQQRGNGAWGTLAQRMNPRASAGMFFNALINTPWQGMEDGAAAQNVQRSAFPGRYSQRMGEADGLIGGYMDGTSNAMSGWHMVGENGPEMVKFNGGETVKTFEDIIAALKDSANTTGGRFQTKVSADFERFADRMVASALSGNTDLRATLEAELRALGQQIHTDALASGREFNVSLESALQRVLDEAGVKIDIQAAGADAQRIQDVIQTEVLPKLELMLRQRVGR